jgi:hypothetical protein
MRRWGAELTGMDAEPFAYCPFRFGALVRKPVLQFAGRKLSVADVATRPGKRLLSMPRNLVDRKAFAASEDISHAGIASAKAGTRRRPRFSPAQARGLKLQRSKTEVNCDFAAGTLKDLNRF